MLMELLLLKPETSQVLKRRFKEMINFKDHKHQQDKMPNKERDKNQDLAQELVE